MATFCAVKTLECQPVGHRLVLSQENVLPVKQILKRKGLDTKRQRRATKRERDAGRPRIT